MGRMIMRATVYFRGGGGGKKKKKEIMTAWLGFGNISIRSDSERRRCLVLPAIRGASNCLII